jgi:hypothetical protein
VNVDEYTMLANVLRENLLITGTNIGCGKGECCACSVNMKGKVVRSCITKMKYIPLTPYGSRGRRARTMKDSKMQQHWICTKCEDPLEKSKVQVRYFGNVFTMEMLKCPRCGTAMVTEEMAVKKMAEAEMLFEDK